MMKKAKRTTRTRTMKIQKIRTKMMKIPKTMMMRRRMNPLFKNIKKHMRVRPNNM